MGILERYLEASLIGGICIILAVLLFLVFGTRFKKKYKMLVWFLILLRLLLPVLHQQESSGWIVEVPNYTLVEFDIPENTKKEDKAIVPEKELVDVLQPVTEEPHGPRQFTTGNVVFAVWLTGAILFAGYYMILYIKMTRKLKHQGQPCEEAVVLEKVKQCAEETGIKKVPKVYRISGSYSSPFSTGVIKKKIYLPELPYAEKDLDYILKHELIHCKNQDVLLKLLMLAANAVHWFNPLVWLMRGLMNQDMELICDETVLLGATKEDCSDYSEIIMSHITAEQINHNSISTSYSQGTRFIKYRFKNIFAGHKKNGIQFCAVFIAVTMLLLHGKIQILELPVVKELANAADTDEISKVADETAEVTKKPAVFDTVDEEKMVSSLKAYMGENLHSSAADPHVLFADAGSGMIVFGRGASTYVYTTKDGGGTWQPGEIPPAGKTMHAKVTCATALDAQSYCVGYRYWGEYIGVNFYLTQDSGKTWARLPLETILPEEITDNMRYAEVVQAAYVDGIVWAQVSCKTTSGRPESIEVKFASRDNGKTWEIVETKEKMMDV